MKYEFSRLIKIRYNIIVLCIYFLSGCGTAPVFDVDARGNTETAVINGSGMFPIKRVDIVRVDGNNIGMMNSSVTVLPGTHIVWVKYFQTYGIFDIEGEGSVTLEALAGRKYSINGTRSNKKLVFWVEDTETGTVVSGQKPE
jgi:hypothetical protein